MAPQARPNEILLDKVDCQSARVERVCKARKITHANTSNGHETQTVQLLLAYFILRLLDMCDDFAQICIHMCKFT